MWGFLKGNARPGEKLDLLMLIAWYPLAALIFVNIFLSTYVCHRIWVFKVGMLHPMLPYLFSMMFVFSLAVILSLDAKRPTSILYWFWAIAIYGACLPVAAWQFLVHLRRSRKPRFERTPKHGDACRLPVLTIGVLLALGAVTCFLAWWWPSPFSPMTLAYGTSFLLFPLLPRLNHSRQGFLISCLALVPGVLVVVALYWMWFWGRL